MTHARSAGDASAGARLEAARVRLGASRDTSAELLAALAHDPAVTVRAAVVLNAAMPPDAQDALATDPDERVRALLARRLAALIPATPPGELHDQAMRTLAALVQDEAVRVRAALADVLKDMHIAPRAIVLRLAQDVAVPVCGPILRLSPLLTTEDLVALVSRHVHTAEQVAQRPGLAYEVSEAVAETADSGAIRALLDNASAQIREATLDALVAQASAHPGWHDPLVRRPGLTAGAARALSEIVADELLGVLAGRGDLDPALVDELRQRLAVRLAPGRVANEDDAAMRAAHALRRENRLTEAALLDTARHSGVRETAAMLAVAAEAPLSAVDRAIAMRSAKGLISLAWKAGFSMHAACAMQAVLAQLGPGQMLAASPVGGFPLSFDEMRWQIDFLGHNG